MFSFVFSIILAGFLTSTVSGVGKWNVTDSQGVCVMLEAKITLEIRYLKTDNTTAVAAIVVPENATTVNTRMSSCKSSVMIAGQSVAIQVLSLNFLDWRLDLNFAQAEALGNTNSTDFNMYQASLSANLASYPNVFVDYEGDSIRSYENRIFENNGSGHLVDVINAAKGTYYFCPHYHTHNVSQDFELMLTSLKAVAFVTNYTHFSGDGDICRWDYRPDDLVPVLIGGGLALVVICVLVVYICYRSRHPQKPPAYLYHNAKRSVADLSPSTSPIDTQISTVEDTAASVKAKDEEEARDTVDTAYNSETSSVHDDFTVAEPQVRV